MSRTIAVYSDSSLTNLMALDSVAIGMVGHSTPALRVQLGARRTNPAWMAPQQAWAGRNAGKTVAWSARDNPFRALNDSGVAEGYFIRLGGLPMGIHTTREPQSLGKRASHGCIRTTLRMMRFLYFEVPEAFVIVK